MRSDVRQLGDLCDFVRVQVNPGNFADDAYVGLEHVASGRFRPNGHGKASDVQSSKYAFERGDVLYGKLRPYLDKAVLTAHPGICSTELLVLRPKADVDPRFLICVLHMPSFIEHAVAGITGVQHPRTSWAHIAEFEIPRFEAPEQETIASLVWQAHDTLVANERVISGGEGLKRCAMATLFTQGLHGDPSQESEIGLVPDGWRVGRLFDFARFQRGFDITKTAQVDGTVPVVSSGGTRSYHNVAAAKGPGVVVGRKGSIGSLHYLEADYWPHDTTLWCTDFLGNLPKFVFYRLHLVDMKRLDSGAANPALNRNALHDEMIAWPHEEEQKGIVNILEAIDLKIDLHRRKLAVLEQLFRALLHKLMTGEIRVSDLDLEALT